MKNLSVSLVIFLLGSLLLTSCRSTCDQTVYYYAKIPVYGSMESIRSDFSIADVQSMDTILRIIELDHAYFLEEKGKGVHVIDKQGSGTPSRTAFIDVPGCLSIEGNGNTLYIGRATDLIIVDVSDLKNITKTRELFDIFNEDFVKQDSFIIDYRYDYVEWLIEDGDCGDSYINPDNSESSIRTSRSPGIDLHISKGHILGCDNTKVNSFGINADGTLTFKASLQINTFANVTSKQYVSSTDDLVVVGSPTSSLQAFANDGLLNRSFSTFISSPFTCGKFHLFDNAILFADFSNDDGINCNSINALHIHPINNNGSRPFLPFEIGFSEPQHISIIDSTMLLCDGSGGFALFDISFPATFSGGIDKFGEITSINSKVSVMSKDRAMVWGEDGLFYINVSQPTNIRIISEIK